MLDQKYMLCLLNVFNSQSSPAPPHMTRKRFLLYNQVFIDIIRNAEPLTIVNNMLREWYATC